MGSTITLNRMSKEAEVTHTEVSYLGKSILSRGNSNHRGPEVEHAGDIPWSEWLEQKMSGGS